MGKLLQFMSKRCQDGVRDATKMLVMVRLAKTYYGIPMEEPDGFDILLRIWRYVPESLKVELRHILAPALRKKDVILNDKRLLQEVDDFLREFSAVQE
ncbi:MAG: hypothetical protein ABSC19_05345 [Syntrophorhabdales bacterium]|jgi:hypothetical protein